MSRALLEKLLQLAQSDATVNQWVRAGISAWEDGEPLDRALGLTGPRAKAARNRALLKAAHLLDPGSVLSDWKRAELLAKTIKHFEGGALARITDMGRSPQTEIEAVLLEAFQAESGRMIRTAKKLYQTLFASHQNGEQGE